MSKAFFNIISSLAIAFVGLSAFAAGGNLIQNGGFEDGTAIWNNSGNFGSNGPDGRTAVWTGGQICKQNGTLAPPSGFIVGTYCGYLWGLVLSLRILSSLWTEHVAWRSRLFGELGIRSTRLKSY